MTTRSGQAEQKSQLSQKRRKRTIFEKKKKIGNGRICICISDVPLVVVVH